MTDTLTARCPEVVYLLSAYVLGDTTLAAELDDYTKVEGLERGADALGELQALLADTTVADADLDAFALAHSSRYLGTGRATLQRVADELQAALERLAAEPDPAEPSDDVADQLAGWIEGQGMIRPADLQNWEWADAGDGRWVVTPPGTGGVIFVVTPTTIRAIQPAYESVPEALRELGIQ